MFKSTITTKGQITIPNKIRNMLNLKEGDIIIFKPLPDGRIVFEKESRLCPVCNGSKKIEQFECIVCQGQGILENNDMNILHELEKTLLRYGGKYGISSNIKQLVGDKEISPVPVIIPQIILSSKEIPPYILNKIQDYYQIKLIADFAPKGSVFPKSHMVPSDILLGEMLNCLKMDESKEKVKKMFKG